MEHRDTVQEMARSTHDPEEERPKPALMWEDTEIWMSGVGYSQGKKPDWETLRADANVLTSKDVLKSRWNKGLAPIDRAKIEDALVAAEMKRKAKTEIGRRVIALRKWDEIGKALALDVGVLESQIDKLQEIADAMRERKALNDKLIEQHTRLELAMSALSSPTPEPKTHRK